MLKKECWNSIYLTSIFDQVNMDGLHTATALDMRDSAIKLVTNLVPTITCIICNIHL